MNSQSKSMDMISDSKTISKHAVPKRKLSASQFAPKSCLNSISDQRPRSTSKPGSSKQPRKVMTAARHGDHGETDNLYPHSPTAKIRKIDARSPLKGEEKRLRVFRKRAPVSYLKKLERATSQRMFVIDRSRSGTEDVPEETIDLAGK